MKKRLQWKADNHVPEISELLSSLHFNTREGLIWLGDRRMVLFHTETIGALRQELIESLGVDTARALLTRIGYAAGCRDAEMAIKLRKPDDRLISSLLVSGAEFHALEGVAAVEIKEAEVDIEAGHMYADFIWKNSFEAQLHLSSYGVGHDPACWIEVGYSSGFLSTSMGKRILVREVACRAQGDENCRCIVKPVEEWGDEATEDLKYFEVQSTPYPKRWPQSDHAAQEKTARFPTPDTSEPLSAGENKELTDRSNVIGASSTFNTILHKIRRVAQTNATVLFLGESGVGKSSFARELHSISKRKSKPFVEVNCAAIPEQLMEAELFGVERGAFTGATERRPGRFEQADGGTLFLDEIGTLSFTAQGKLLRVIQTGEFEPLGTVQTKKVDIRIIAATNQNLQTAVKEGAFREDLFFRLNVFPILIPPLRERRDDIPVLLEHILRKFSIIDDKPITGVTAQALRAILSYNWPGNIREMENVIERGIILSEPGEPLALRHLVSFDSTLTDDGTLGLNALGSLSADAPEATGQVDIDSLGKSGTNLEVWATNLIKTGHANAFLDAGDALIKAAIKETDGNLTRAAAILGLTRNQVEYRVKKWNNQ